jgi:hypothetical protein
MKKIIFLFVLTLTTLHARPKVVTFNDTPRIVSAAELTFDKIQELIQSKNSDFTLELKEGTMLPLQFLVKNRIFSAMIDPNFTFKVDRTCYLRIANKKCYMSEDLVHWQKAEKFFDGKSTIQLTPSTNKPGFVLETNVVPHSDNEESD